MPQVIVLRARQAGPLLLLFLLTGRLASGQGVECPPGCSSGRWSADAVDLSTETVKAPYKTRDIRIYAPNRQKVARIVKEHWWIEINGAKVLPSSKTSFLMYPAEFAWAPDSQSFYITESVGYSTGYHIEVYRITDSKLFPVGNVNGIIRRDFDRHHRCFDGQMGNDPNVAGLKWLDDPDRLLVVAEAPPIGICKDAEYFAGYEISLRSGQIVGRFSPQRLADRWGKALGDRLKSNFQYLSAEKRSAVP